VELAKRVDNAFVNPLTHQAAAHVMSPGPKERRRVDTGAVTLIQRFGSAANF
jgi:hypothetical protein